MMEDWKNGFWDTGVLDQWSAEGGTIKLKMDNILIKNPQFHHSTIPLFHN
jgi:hypothetical protein